MQDLGTEKLEWVWDMDKNGMQDLGTEKLVWDMDKNGVQGLGTDGSDGSELWTRLQCRVQALMNQNGFEVWTGQFTETSIPRPHYTMSKPAVQRNDGKTEYHNIKRDGVRVMMGVKQGDSGQRSKPVGFIN